LFMQSHTPMPSTSQTLGGYAFAEEMGCDGGYAEAGEVQITHLKGKTVRFRNDEAAHPAQPFTHGRHGNSAVRYPTNSATCTTTAAICESGEATSSSLPASLIGEYAAIADTYDHTSSYQQHMYQPAASQGPSKHADRAASNWGVQEEAGYAVCGQQGVARLAEYSNVKDSVHLIKSEYSEPMQ
jgi:hypothetical protein